MRKAILPMIASLALCGAATAALVATNARAAQSGHRPMMIALMTSGDVAGENTATPPVEGGPPELRDRMEPHRAQMCKDMYARKAGELAFLEAKLSLNAKQAPLYARWKQVSLDVAKQREGECAAPERRTEARGHRFSVVDRLALEEDMLKKRLSAIQSERPALAAFYNTLTPAQQEEFGRGGMHPMARRMMLGMMDRVHPGMGPAPMDRGRMGHDPMEEPPGPPPAH